MVNTEVHPTLTGDLSLPVAAGVIVDKFLFLGHPKQPVEFHNGLFKLLGVIVFLHIIDFVILCNDALRRDETKAHSGITMNKATVFCTQYILGRKKTTISKTTFF